MKIRDVKSLDGHALTSGGRLRGWLIWPFVMVEHGLFFNTRLVWRAHHHPFCAERDATFPRCEVTGLQPCPWHPDGGNHPGATK